MSGNLERLGLAWFGLDEPFGPLVVVACRVPSEIRNALRAQAKSFPALGVRRGLNRAARNLRAILPYEAVRVSPERFNQLLKDHLDPEKILDWAARKALFEMIAKCPEVTHVSCRGFRESAFMTERMEALLGPRELDLEDPDQPSSITWAASLLAHAEYRRDLIQLAEEAELPLDQPGMDPEKLWRSLEKRGGIQARMRFGKLHSGLRGAAPAEDLHATRGPLPRKAGTE